MCVAARIPFMKLTALGHEGQYGIKSGIVNVPLDVPQTLEMIPQQASTESVVELTWKRAMRYRGAYKKELVRPKVIWNAAQELVKSPLYVAENISLNPMWPSDQGKLW